MKVYEWNSYSCNNSSDIRLVAKFTNAEKAQKMLAELEVFFEEHSSEHDTKIKEEIFEYPGGVTDIAKTFGKKYEHDWKKIMIWGDERYLGGDEPTGIVLDDTLVLYHTYMGGYGTDLESVLKNAGATNVFTDQGAPIIFVEVVFENDSTLEDELIELFEQRHGVDLDEWEFPWELEDELMCDEEFSFVNLGTKCTFVIPLPIIELGGLKDYLEENAKSFSIRVATQQDIDENKKRDLEAQKESREAPQGDVFSPTGLSFLFTGKLASMTRKEGQERVEKIGAKNAKSVNKSLDILVIGDEGSPLFGEGTKGSKHKKADEFIEEGSNMKIISESLFLRLEK